MSLETVVEDIREQAQQRADKIREQAQQRADKIREEAQSEAREIREEAQSEVERQIEREREQAISSANLAAKQERLKARRNALETVRERVEEALASMGGEQREELTRTLLEASLAEFDGEVHVYGRPDDRDLLESILEEYDATVGGEHDCLGGVVVESPGSRVRVNNTFDALLEEVWEEHVQEISNRLFDDTER